MQARGTVEDVDLIRRTIRIGDGSLSFEDVYYFKLLGADGEARRGGANTGRGRRRAIKPASEVHPYADPRTQIGYAAATDGKN